MWLQELKIWLVPVIVVGFCYFCQAAQTQSETYHGELAAYMKNDTSPQSMNQTAQKLGIGNSANDPVRTCNLTVYYLIHPPRN